MKDEEITSILKDITDELKTLVEINRIQTENIIENSRILTSLFNRQIALEKAIVSTMPIDQREIFDSVFDESLKRSYA